MIYGRQFQEEYDSREPSFEYIGPLCQLLRMESQWIKGDDNIHYIPPGWGLSIYDIGKYTLLND